MEGVQSKPLSLFHYSLVHSLPPSRPPSLYRALSHSFLIYIILYACTVYMYFPPSLPLSVCFLVYNIHDNVHVHVHYVSTRTCTCILSPPPPPPPPPLLSRLVKSYKPCYTRPASSMSESVLSWRWWVSHASFPLDMQWSVSKTVYNTM